MLEGSRGKKQNNNYNTRTDTGFISLNSVDFESKIEESAIFEYVVFYELKSTMDFLPKAASI